MTQGSGNSSRFAGVEFPRDLCQPGSTAWRYEGGDIVCANTKGGEYPAFVVPQEVKNGFECEVEFSMPPTMVQYAYLKVMFPTPKGWSSMQVFPDNVVTFVNGRQQRPVPLNDNEKHLLTLSYDSKARLVIHVDGTQYFDTRDEGSPEVPIWPGLKPGHVNIGAETKGGPPFKLHAIRLRPADTPARPGSASPASLPATTKPVATVPPSPALPLPTAAEGWIDLLAKADVRRDSLQVLWTLANGVLSSPAEPKSATTPDGHNTFAFPIADLPLNYDLHYRISRNKPGAAIVLPFQRGKEAPALYVDGGYDLQVLESDSFRSGNPGRTWFPHNDTTHDVLMEVRENRLSVSFDGKTVLERDGALPKGQDRQPFFKSATHNGPIVGVGVCGGLITIHSAAYRPADVRPAKIPATPEPSPTVADETLRKSVNLIPLLNVKRDGVSDPTTGANVWQLKNAALTFTDTEKAGRIVAPVSLRHTRDYEIELLWKKRLINIPGATSLDSGYIALDVPVDADRWVRVEVAHAGDKVNVGGTRIGFTGARMQSQAGMRVVVHRQDDKLSVKIDGNDVGTITGLARLAAADLGTHAIFKSDLLPVVYCARGDHEIAEWTVRALEGGVRLLWEPSLLQDPRIAQLEAGFRARFESDAQKPFLAAVATLNQSYLTNGLGKARAAAQAKGSLAEITALDAEKAFVGKEARVPADDAADTPASLKSLRGTYRAAYAKLFAERDAKAAPLLDIYVKALDTHVVALTKAGKLEEARKVQQLRDEKAALKTAPVPVQAAAPAKPAPISTDAPFTAATFLANNGGTCAVVKDGVRSEVKVPADIPAAPFEVVELSYDTYLGARKDANSGDFQALNGLRTLRRVLVRAPECKLLKDDAYAFLAGNEELDFINLEGVPSVTDAVLKHLADSKKLTTLAVQYAPGFTGEGLPAMPFLSTLLHVDFLGSGLNDKGIEALAACTQLQSLRATTGSASDEAYATLGKLPKLTDLRVDNTGFGDKAAAAIAATGVLQYLDVSFTRISNKGLEKLEALTSLTTLVIRGVKVSDAAVARLQKALPNCTVMR